MPSLSFYLLFSRFWELAAGVLLCLLCDSEKKCLRNTLPSREGRHLGPYSSCIGDRLETQVFRSDIANVRLQFCGLSFAVRGSGASHQKQGLM